MCIIGFCSDIILLVIRPRNPIAASAAHIAVMKQAIMTFDTITKIDKAERL